MGIAMVAKMPKIAMTTTSSIMLKPQPLFGCVGVVVCSGNAGVLVMVWSLAKGVEPLSVCLGATVFKRECCTLGATDIAATTVLYQLVFKSGVLVNV